MIEPSNDHLIGLYLDDRIAEADARVLADRLTADPALRAQLAGNAVLSDRLSSAMRRERSHDAFVDALTERIRACRDNQFRKRVMHSLHRAARPTSRLPIGGRGILGIAAAVVVASALTAVILTSTGGQPGGVESKAAPVATLVWADAEVIADEPLVTGGSVRPQRVRTQEGEAEFTTTSGVVVSARGPTELRFDTPNRVAMMRGRVLYDCPHTAAGFTVLLPHGSRVVDLGTRFRIDVDDDGVSTVHVTEGAVEIRRPDAQAIRVDAGLPIRVIAGGSIERIEHSDLDIANASFELPGVGDQSVGYVVDGWEAVGEGVEFGVTTFGSEFLEPVPGGRLMAVLNTGAAEQTLDTPLIGNLRYTLGVVVGNRPGPNSPNYTIELYAGSTQLGAATNPVIPDKGRFARVQLVVDCPPDHPARGQSLRIVLRSNGSLDTHTQNHFDDVRLTIEAFDPAESSINQVPPSTQSQGDRP